jgi:hypothetical protein
LLFLGAEAMRIDSSGFVGIGLTNPAAQLHVNTNSTGRSNVYLLELLVKK